MNAWLLIFTLYTAGGPIGITWSFPAHTQCLEELELVKVAEQNGQARVVVACRETKMVGGGE